MRQIGTLPSEPLAARIADHLLASGITSRVIPEAGGYGLWIHREDEVPRAAAELARFLENPDDPAYDSVRDRARKIRAQQARDEKEHRRATIHIRNRWGGPSLRNTPVTMITIGLALAVAPMSLVMGNREWVEPLFFTNYEIVSPDRIVPEIGVGEDGQPTVRRPPVEFRSEGWGPIRSGQIWRLITPIFIHFNILHIAFNLYWFYHLGGSIEMRKGPWKLLALIVVIGIGSNICEYLWEERTMPPGVIAQFGGLSGVLYGLFGYIWMKSEYEPEAGLGISRQTISTMLLWLVICMTGIIGSIANAAHLGGLGIGILIAIAPHFVSRLRP